MIDNTLNGIAMTQVCLLPPAFPIKPVLLSDHLNPLPKIRALKLRTTLAVLPMMYIHDAPIREIHVQGVNRAAEPFDRMDIEWDEIGNAAG